MTDPIATAAPAALAAASPAAPNASPVPLEPADTRMFASMMRSEDLAAPAGPSMPANAAQSFAAQFDNTRSFEEIRTSMLQSYDPRDPIKSMFTMASNGMEAQMLFSKLHIATSLASAATSLFGSLLKNQG
jgi:hypothetical protein